MKTSRKQELKGAFKAIVAIFVVGLAIGIGYATVVITDEGIWVDNSEVLVEGNCTNWTYQWGYNLTNGLSNSDFCSFNIDDQNGVLSVSWRDSSEDARFGRYNIEDFSTIFESPAGSDYVQVYPNACWGTGTSQFTFGNAYFGCGAISNSLSSYTLLGRSSYMDVEIWRSTETSALWSHNVTADVPSATYIYTGAVSSTGKWVVIEIQRGNWGDNWWQLLCYEGS